MEKIAGVVKTFNSVKGFGFIDDGEGHDCFFHYSSLNIDGFKTIKPGTKVLFEKNETEKGFRAVNIDIVKD